MHAAVDVDDLAGDAARALDQPDDGIGDVLGCGGRFQRRALGEAPLELARAVGAVRGDSPGVFT